MVATIWVFERLAIILPVALLIVFQPELRSFFERAGRRGLLFVPSRVGEREDMETVIETIVQALEEMSEEHTGALVVLERQINLHEYINTGERIDARVRKDLLKAIFYKGNPLHDGAVIIRGDRVASARSFLPLSDSRDIPSHLGTRHRAALGITESSDAVSFVASEETGHLSLFHAGRPAFRLTPVTMRHMAREIIIPESEQDQRLFRFPVGLTRLTRIGARRQAGSQKAAESHDSPQPADVSEPTEDGKEAATLSAGNDGGEPD
jgi:diadenylate cyclase